MAIMSPQIQGKSVINRQTFLCVKASWICASSCGAVSTVITQVCSVRCAIAERMHDTEGESAQSSKTAAQDWRTVQTFVEVLVSPL